ncbi:MAG: FkbM family methyltransferase [Deltaproteobacteria bacterium]|nr:FkbM family methyltransferase [Deltaproteobacteria bacterium]
MVKSCQIPGLSDIYEYYFGSNAKGRFVDVGSFDGCTWSNTFPLADNGWEGLLVEPLLEPCLVSRIVYAGNPKIDIVNCCAGNFIGEVQLFEGGALSTIVPAMVDVYNELEWAKSAGLSRDKITSVRISTLDEMLTERGWRPGIDLVVIDVEGSELQVLEGFSLGKWRPVMLIVECHEADPHPVLSQNAPEINARLHRNGYNRIFSDHINNIYIRNDVK